MATVGSSGSLERLACDFEEDIATRWVPDVLNSFDLDECLETPSLSKGDVQFVDVPKPDGGCRVAPVLSAQALRALRDAVAPLRQISDSILDPSVCGYRTGSTSGSAYSDEYMRFRDIGKALAEDHRYVVVADVQSFFGSVDADVVGATMLGPLGEAWQPIRQFLVGAKNVGILGLPAGYGDARLIANHVLGVADKSIGTSFTRWVDDYRIYAESPAVARRAIRRLGESLQGLGLKLNDKKLEIIRSDEYLARRHGAPLESVYHPKSEPHEAVRANLRAVFLQAVNEDNRRLLRFALPRLAEQKDTIAVQYALREIGQGSVDTPRLVFYLSAFLSGSDVREGIEILARTPELSPWTTMRLCPLLCSIALQEPTVEALRRAIEITQDPALWAALLRVLAVHGEKDLVVDQVANKQPLDPRAAIGACVDVGQSVPKDLELLAPGTARAAASIAVVPHPTAYTLL